MSNKVMDILRSHTSKVDKTQGQEALRKQQGIRKEAPSEFDNILGDVQGQGQIQFSKHAEKRLMDRQLNLDSTEYIKLKEAFSKLRDKGGRDSLVITDNAAYIVDVKNNKVVTAMNKNQLSENVFTKIDSTVFIN